MAIFLTSAFFTVAVLTAIASFLLTLHVWEHRRYAISRCRRHADENKAAAGRVAVIVPCKGIDFDLEGNLRRLLAQDYDDYEIHFVVDSLDDLACTIIRELILERPRIPIRLIVAGRATHCGQKIHNLMVATGQIDESVQTLVFVDSDAGPRPDWLRHLVAPLSAINVNAVTSYRWFVPRRATLGNLLLFSINATAMGMVCSRHQAILWGGTWAMSRELFETINIREQWRGRLSDDLVVSHRMDKFRLNIAFEPRCVVTSPIDYRGRAMWEFLRRQCYVGRWYRTRTWALGLVFTSVSMATFWGGLIAGVIGTWTNTFGIAVPAFVLAAAMWGFSAVRARWRQDAGRWFVQQDSPSLRTARLFDICAYPLALTVIWIGLISAAIGRTICWRGIAYRINRDRKVEVLGESETETIQPHVAVSWPGRLAVATEVNNESFIAMHKYSQDDRRRSA